jgi:hypothetical protein
MSYKECIPVVAGEDLSAAQYHAIEIDGTIAQNGATAVGILQNNPESGEDAALAYAGRSNYRAGGAITIGARLTVTGSGWFTTVVSGDNAQCYGTALKAVSSGGIGEGMFNFTSPALY